MHPSHPLHPLTTDEIDRAVECIRRSAGLGPRLRFASIEALEPVKGDYLLWRDDAASAPTRQAFAVLVDCDAERGYEVLVDLRQANADDDGDGDADAASVVRVTQLAETVQPAIHGDEFFLAGDVVRADPRFVEALRLRGIDDPSMVHVEAWSAGAFEEPGRRLVRALSWLRDGSVADNMYARPLGGLVAVVDLNRMELVRLDDHFPGLGPPEVQAPYHDGAGEPLRDDLRALHVSQPDGPSFTLDLDRRLRWQKWDLIVGFHPREGLVLHDIAYVDRGERRQICHRASIAELVIPYGDPNPTVQFKSVFDTGEYGLGPLANPLSLGCDCLGEIRYLDVVTHDLAGRPVTIPQAICVHEEDDNLLWKHTDLVGRVDRARSRRLVISTWTTVGNYEYGYFWYFHQDGSWAFEAKLTGIVHSAGVPLDAPRSPHSLPLAAGVVTSAHQHFFCARLDLDVDGPANTAFCADSVAAPWGPGNPFGSAWSEERTVFTSEANAGADVSTATARRFRVEQPARLNRIGDPVSYELISGENALPLAHPDASVRQRARFLDHQLWVTAYDPAERYPAGEYPNQSSAGEGIPRWIEADRPLENADVVLWYTFAAHHFPRLEDWPVMPVARTGFHLRPVGYFDRNPALDVPPPGTVGGHCA